MPFHDHSLGRSAGLWIRSVASAAAEETKMAGNWVTFSAPNGVSADTMILLTDGSVLIHNADFPGKPGTGGKDWYRLTPDARGDYNTGSWSSALNMATGRQFFASGVLMDGRVYAVGGEYSNLFPQDQCALGEIFDPTTNSWSPMMKPTPIFDFITGDCPSCVLADGRVLFGGALGPRTAIWDPSTGGWKEAGLGLSPGGTQSKKGNCDEESWALMPEGTVVAISVEHPGTGQKYLPARDLWIDTGSLQNLVVSSISGTPVEEIGGELLVPDGRMLAIGGNGRMALYTPSALPEAPGTWANALNFPPDSGPLAPVGLMTVIDGPATLLPDGSVMCVAGKTFKLADPLSYWSNPTTFFLYDVAGNTITQMATQPSNHNTDTWTGCLLLLPNGCVLYSCESDTIAMYTPDAAERTSQPAWRPTISSVPTTLAVGQVATLTGTQLNGLSQANGYGDDRQNATNFPLVRVTDAAGNLRYLPTSAFSTMGVATGAQLVSASFRVPGNLPTGPYSLVVIANAIASTPVNVVVTP
jgi:hypothetical protein